MNTLYTLAYKNDKNLWFRIVFANVNEHVLTTDQEPIDAWRDLFDVSIIMLSLKLTL